MLRREVSAYRVGGNRDGAQKLLLLGVIRSQRVMSSDWRLLGDHKHRQGSGIMRDARDNGHQKINKLSLEF